MINNVVLPPLLSPFIPHSLHFTCATGKTISIRLGNGELDVLLDFCGDRQNSFRTGSSNEEDSHSFLANRRRRPTIHYRKSQDSRVKKTSLIFATPSTVSPPPSDFQRLQQIIIKKEHVPRNPFIYADKDRVFHVSNLSNSSPL